MMNIVITIKASGFCDKPVGTATADIGANDLTGNEDHWQRLVRAVLSAAIADYDLQLATTRAESEYVP